MLWTLAFTDLRMFIMNFEGYKAILSGYKWRCKVLSYLSQAKPGKPALVFYAKENNTVSIG